MKADRALGPQAPTATALAGVHVALLFEKPSLRTRVDLRDRDPRARRRRARTCRREFADGAREPLEDVARNLERWVHGARRSAPSRRRRRRSLARAAPRLHVINALTDEQHPCQALADVLTMREHWGGRAAAARWPTSATATTSPRRWRTRASMLGITVHIASPRGLSSCPTRSSTKRAAVARDGADVQPLHRPAGRRRRRRRGLHRRLDVDGRGSARPTSGRRIFAPYQVNDRLMAAAAPARAVHALPAGAPRRGGDRRGHRVGGLGRLRSGREPPAHAEGAAADAARMAAPG